MPPLRLTSLLHTALPHVSDNGRALLSVLGCVNGHPPRPKELAEWLGFHDRYQLARALRREGLPPRSVRWPCPRWPGRPAERCVPRCGIRLDIARCRLSANACPSAAPPSTSPSPPTATCW